MTLFGLLAVSASAGAQNWVERDNTIGPPCVPGGSCVLDDDLLLDRWTIPATVGDYSSGNRNLFHSFDTFDIGEGFTALFTRDALDPLPENLIVRVTGDDTGSQIAGAIDTVGPDVGNPYYDGTDLFLLNPWGVAFTATSSLNLDGSLYASTADVLRIPDTDLDIRVATDHPVLSDMDPTAFGFLVPEPAGISVDRTGEGSLEGPPAGETFALVGGPVMVLGDGATVKMPGVTVALASVRSAGIDVPVDVAALDARSLAVDTLGDVVIGETARVDVEGAGGGDAGRIVVRGGRFTMLQGADLSASVEDGEAWKDNDGLILPAIDIEVAGRTIDGSVEGVAILGGGSDSTTVFALSKGENPSGGIQIYGPKVEIAGERMAIETRAQHADGADITIEGDVIEIVKTGSATARIRSWNRSGADEPFQAGAIRIGTEDTESVLVDGGFDVHSWNQSDEGFGGDVVLRGDVVRVAGGAMVRSTVEDAGTGGGVTVVAGLLDVEGGQIVSVTEDSATGGALDVTADTVTVSQLGVIQSIVDAGTSPDAVGGDVTVRADQVSVIGMNTATNEASQISAVTGAGSQGGGGKLSVQARSLSLRDGGQLRTSTRGAGDAGALEVVGRDALGPAESVLVTGVSESVTLGTVPSGIFAQTLAGGAAGSIDIAAKSVHVLDGGQVAASSTNTGLAGSVRITDAEDVVVRGELGRNTGILAEVAAGGCADGCGNVEITTGTLEVSRGGFITVSTIDVGKAGSVIVTADEVTVTGKEGFNRSGIFAQTVDGGPGAGDSGRIELNVAERLIISDEGQVAVESKGGGFAGDIEIRGAREVRVDSGGEISAQVGDTRTPGPGDDPTADILIEDVDRVFVGEGSLITAATVGSGDAGTVTIGSDAARVGELTVAGGRISSETSAAGAGGDVALRAIRRVVLRDGAQVTAQSTGSADAGSIFIDGGKQFLAFNNSLEPGEGVVSTRAEQAAGGTILIQASKLVYLSDSRIETQVEQSGTLEDGGDFGTPRFFGSDDSTAPAELVVLNRSRIVASAVNGDGGNILIDGTFLPSEALLDDEDFAGARDSVLDAKSETGVPGQIVVTSPGSELAGQLVPLPSNYLDASKLLLTPCAARTARTGSFTIELQAVDPPPDAPFTAGWAQEDTPGAGPASCPSEETLR